MNAKFRWLLIVLALVWGTAPATAPGAEPVAAFLEALRGRHYYDEALDYLDQLQAAGQLDEATLEAIPYERGLILLTSAADTSDPAVRNSRLARAAETFEAFCAAHPEHAQAASARNQLAAILIEHGRIELRSADAAASDSAGAAAREYFEQARGQFASSAKQLEKKLAGMPKLIPPDQPELKQQKLQCTADLAQTRLLLASIDYESAKTHAPDSAAANKQYTAAAESYAALYQQYRTRAVGLLARLWEGSCYQALGEYNRALGCFRELAELPDQDEIRSIRTQATRHALECWTHDTVKKYPAAIECGERWEKQASGDAFSSDALAIRYLTGLAYREQSKSLSAEDPARQKLIGSARQHIQPVAEQPGEFQQPAKMLLVSLNTNQKTADSEAAPPTAAPQKFLDALTQAREALAEMQAATQQMAASAGKADQAALDTLRRQKVESAQRALDLLRLALRLADAETPPEDVNSARYYLCFLCWDLGRYYDAAVLGEFLADRYPDTLFGRQGARIALAAYVRLYGESPEADRPFLVEQIQRVAEMTFNRWPDQPEAEEAALTLVNFAAASDQIDQATKYLDKISTDSPRRGQAELRAGQALWTAYLRALRADDDDRPAPDKLEALLKQARETLEQGVTRVEASGQIDANLAGAVFSLAQIFVEAGEYDQAISWLEHPKHGPLALVEKNHPAAARDGFAVETYKLALRTYVAATPQQLEKAEAAMSNLEELVQGGDPAGAANLTAIYISLGRQLQQQLEDLRKSGKTKQLDAVSKAFESFLDRAVKRDAGGSLASLNWVGETYYSLGAAFAEEGPLTSARAKEYFAKATDAYQRMLALAEKDPAYRDQPDALVAIRLRLADCYRRAGQFDKAIEAVAAVLEQRSMLLGAQVQAAEIYQSQGATDAKGYVRAIKGDLPQRDGKNLVWGWAKISKMTMNNDKFTETFHQSRLAIAESRYLYALAQTNKTTRSKVLQAAVQDLWSTYKLRPTLGGAETTARYDRTLKKIQKALGQPELGLNEFKQRDAASADVSKS